MGNKTGKLPGQEEVNNYYHNHNKEFAKQCIRSNIDSALPSGDTLLLAAIEDCNTEAVHVLLEAGANVNSCDRHGDSPLSTAIRTGSKEIVEILLSHKDIKVNITDISGISPLHVACIRKRPSLVTLLLQYGAESWPLPADSSIQDIPPLMLCLEVSHLPSMVALLEGGASPNAIDNKGDTPLIKAIYKRQQEFVWLLLKYKPDLRIRNKYDNTALQYALQSNQCDIVEALLQRGLASCGHDPYDYRLEPRQRALFLAILNKCLKCFQVLLDAGEDIFLETQGISPLLCTLDHRSTLLTERDQHCIRYVPPFIIGSERLNLFCKDLANSGSSFETVWNKGVWYTTTVDILAGRELAHIFCIRCYGFGGTLPVKEQQVAYFRALALNAADEAMSLFCYAFYTPSEEDVTIVKSRSARRRPGTIRGTNQPPDDLCKTDQIALALEEFRTNPRSLENLCTIAIRRAITDNVLCKASKLGLPSKIVDLVTFENTPSFATEIKRVL